MQEKEKVTDSQCSIVGTYLMGLHVRSNAHANPSSRKRFRNWYRELARVHFLGSSFANCIEEFDLEILLPICWYVNDFGGDVDLS